MTSKTDDLRGFWNRQTLGRKIALVAAAVVLVSIPLAALSGDPEADAPDTAPTTVEAVTEETSAPTTEPEATPAPTVPDPLTVEWCESTDPAEQDLDTVTACLALIAESEPVETAPPAPEFTVSQENAIRSAESYLGFTDFSRSGLVDQLEFEGFSTEDAEFAVAHIEAEGGVDWLQQAADSAASYLDFTSFSCSGLIDQLEFEGFTPEQAQFGAQTTGICG